MPALDMSLMDRAEPHFCDALSAAEFLGNGSYVGAPRPRLEQPFILG
jgi:hypothetical protein